MTIYKLTQTGDEVVIKPVHPLEKKVKAYLANLAKQRKAKDENKEANPKS